jgi:TP901 family phage tail tape measure protein
MADLKVAVEIAGSDKLSGPAGRASRSLDQLDASASRSHVSLLKAGAAAGGIALAGATALAGGFAYVTSTAADFEKEISGVAAVTGASAEEMAQLQALALQLGADTSFSAKEAAIGLGELAKGGVSVADIMGGAATAALNLAAAGGVELGEAAAIAANAMSLFNLSGKDMGMVVDQIAGFANATTGSVNDFKFALSSVGAVAHLTGQDFDQTATAIALMGKAGILGSDAGTSLKTMLLNLQPTTKAQVAAWKELGLTTDTVANAFVNADGSFKDLRDIAGILSTALDGMSESQKAAYLEVMFGSDAIRAATVLAEAGAAGFDSMADAMSHVSAEAVAAQRLDNLSGSVEQLNGSVETAAITLGMEFTPALKEVADNGTQFLNKVVIPWIKEYGPGMGQQLKGVVVFLGQLYAAFQPIWEVAGPAIRTVVDAIGQSLDSTMAYTYASIVAFVNLKNGIGEFFDAIGTRVDTTLTSLGTLIDGLASFLGGKASDLGDALGGGLLRGITQTLQGAGEAFVVPIRAGLNYLISIVNDFLKRWNGIKIEIPTVDVPGGGTLGGGTVGVPPVPLITPLAAGTSDFAGGWAMVGEQGPELVNLPSRSAVYPHGSGPGIDYDKLAAALARQPIVIQMDRQPVGRLVRTDNRYYNQSNLTNGVGGL